MRAVYRWLILRDFQVVLQKPREPPPGSRDVTWVILCCDDGNLGLLIAVFLCSLLLGIPI
jgi:hypothetical protein